MKKFLSLVAIAAVSFSAMAQESQSSASDSQQDEAIYNVRTNSFWSNWFISADYSLGYNRPSEKVADGTTVDPSFGDYLTNGFTIGVGKWFTPGLGLRTKFTGIKTVNFSLTDVLDKQTAFRFNEDILFNITNMIWGYKQNRVYNAIPYVGFGMGINTDSESAAYGYSAGLLNTFRLNDKWSVNAEIAYSMFDHTFNGEGGFKYEDAKILKKQDNGLNIEVGLTYNLGKTKGWKKAVDEDALRDEFAQAMAAKQSELDDANNENARLRDELAKKPKEVIREVKAPATVVPQSVFFRINSAKLSDGDNVNLQAVAEAAKANSAAKVYVTGYADNATGTAEYNQSLSEKRAEAVASKLEELGVSRDQMVVEGKGGDNAQAKAKLNRRAIVSVK